LRGAAPFALSDKTLTGQPGPRGSFQRRRSQLVVYFALLLALRLAPSDVDGGSKSLAACRWSDRAALTSICRTGVRNEVRTGVRPGVRTLDREDRSEIAWRLAFRRHRLADIYMSMSSVPEFAAVAGGLAVRLAAVSLAVALLTFAFWVDRPAA
jgi:hypothetical protein